MSILTEEAMRRAVEHRDKCLDGAFFYGVITTGVFCKPSCTSRSAKPENMRFFTSIKTAMAAGFRPCKRCAPLGGNEKLDRVVKIARHIEKHYEEDLTLQTLAGIVGQSPSQLQKSFKENFGISPKAYHDAVRIRVYKRSLQQGRGVSDAIHSAGFGSVSRVYGESTRNIGMTPKAYRSKGAGESITYACHATELGLIMMAGTKKGICFVHFGDDEKSLYSLLENEFSEAKLVASEAQDSPELDHWMHELVQHINEGAPRPDLPLDMQGTAFQMKVWQFLLSIQDGDVLSYSEVADRIDKPKAIRAVASACAKNRIAVLIPCHRVLRGDGTLGGYRWGLERKRALLDAEKKDSAATLVK